jgi:hypothetical protein
MEFIYNVEKIGSWRYLSTLTPVNYIVITHLYAEHGLDYLIFKNCKTYKEILDSNGFSKFFFKLRLCFEMGLIDEDLYNSIKVLNDIRNKMVHKIEVDYSLLKKILNKNKKVKDKIFLSAEYIGLQDEFDKVVGMIRDIGNITVKPLHELIIDKYF